MKLVLLSTCLCNLILVVSPYIFNYLRKDNSEKNDFSHAVRFS